MPAIRRADAHDLKAVAAIQAQSPEASQWDPAHYLKHDFWVAEADGSVVAFLVARRLASDESEILNLAVAPEFRRRGIAGALFEASRREFCGNIFLEVRESNSAAALLYKSLGFKVVNVRPGYYSSPPEAAIVMKFHSC